MVDPLPISPLTLSPQAKTVPSEVSARLWRSPAATATGTAAVGRVTAIGVSELVVEPSPS